MGGRDGEKRILSRELLITVTLLVLSILANEGFRRLVSETVWIREGDQMLALRVLEIVAVLLPLVAIFVQILFRRADDEDSPLHNLADTLLAPLLVTFLGLFAAGFFAIVVTMLGGIGVVAGIALVSLAVGLAALLGVVLLFIRAAEEEYGIDTQQQLLGSSDTEVEHEEREETK